MKITILYIFFIFIVSFNLCEAQTTEIIGWPDVVVMGSAINIVNEGEEMESENRAVSSNNGEEEMNEAEDPRETTTGDEEDQKNDNYVVDRRTTIALVVAAGLNNTLQENQAIEDSEFKITGSRFFEVGLAWKTRVLDNSNWLRIKYGFSFQFNGLKPNNNRYFVEEGDHTFLQEHDLKLDKSKFRMDNLVLPVHFEFGSSYRYDTDNEVSFSTYRKFKIGLGGYAGFNIGERQKLKYKEDGNSIKLKRNSGYNTNDFIYGLSGYIGWGENSIYLKYDINPLFEEPNAELNNISLGLRFDLE